MLPVVLSAVAAGVIATTVMLFVLYLPVALRRAPYDVLTSLGSAVTREVDDRSRLVGALVYYGFGIAFAFLYGLAAQALLATLTGPQLPLAPGWPVAIDLIYPVLGAAIGLGHGVLVALVLTVVILENHPVAAFRSRMGIVVMNVIAHVVYGIVVMFFHSQFLQLLA